MRASVTNLILATNTSYIILYKENIEGETFGHFQRCGSTEQEALSSAGALCSAGEGVP
jgi:hypothetical protein